MHQAFPHFPWRRFTFRNHTVITLTTHILRKKALDAASGGIDFLEVIRREVHLPLSHLTCLTSLDNITLSSLPLSDVFPFFLNTIEDR